MTATASSDDGWMSDPLPGQSAVRRRLAATVNRVYGSNSSVTPRALFACLLLRVRELVLAQIDDALKPMAMSTTRYHALAIICRAQGGLQLGELAARTFVQPSTMTSTIDRLLRDGLIERRADPTDRRGILAIATGEGLAVYEKARAALVETEFGLSEVDIEAINPLVETLDKVAVALQDTDPTVKATVASNDDGGMSGEFSGASAVRQRLATTLSRVYGLESSATRRALFASLILRVRDLVLAEIDDALKQLGTSNTRYQVLAILCRAPNGLQLGELAARAFVQPSTMTSTIDRLLRDGLIERRADLSDRRSILAVATRKGRAVYEKARAALAETEFGLGGMDAGTIDTLVECLDKVAAVLERQDTTAARLTRAGR